MKLTYNNSETIITVEGTQEEVKDWYKCFVHSQTACESIPDIGFVELINRKTSNEEADKAVDNVNNPVNDPRAGEPDEYGWMTWTATEDTDYPVGLNGREKVDFIAPYSTGNNTPVSVINWSNITNSITKFRISK